MSILSQMMSGAASIIIAQFNDYCDLKNLVLKNVDGQMVEDTLLTTTVTGIKCVFEPWRYKGEHVHLNLSGLASTDITHKITMELTDQTKLIKLNYVITIHANGVHPQIVFEQPVRLDESLSPLLIVGATLRNQ